MLSFVVAGVAAQAIDHPVNYSKIMTSCLMNSQACTYSANPLFVSLPAGPEAKKNVENLLTLYNANTSAAHVYQTSNVTQNLAQFAELNKYQCACNKTGDEVPKCYLSEQSSSSLTWLWILLGVLTGLLLLYGLYRVASWALSKGASNSNGQWTPNTNSPQHIQFAFDDKFVTERNSKSGETILHRIVRTTGDEKHKEIEVEGRRKFVFQRQSI